MTTPEHNTITAIGSHVDTGRVERAAQALAAVEGKTWQSASIRTYYRGLALHAIDAYFTTPTTEES